MEKKKTSVDWLVDEIEKNYITNNGMLDPTVVMSLKRQAKQMEKEQHEETWFSSRVEDMGDEFKVEQKSFEDYYNETYGENKN